MNEQKSIDRERIKHIVLAYGFKTAVNEVVYLGYSLQEAYKIVQEIHDSIPGAKENE